MKRCEKQPDFGIHVFNCVEVTGEGVGGAGGGGRPFHFDF